MANFKFVLAIESKVYVKERTEESLERKRETAFNKYFSRLCAIL